VRAALETDEELRSVHESHFKLLYSVPLPQQCSSMLASVALISQEFHTLCMTMTKLRLQCMHLGRVSH